MVDSLNWIQDKYGFKVNLTEVPWNKITEAVQTSVAANDMYDVFFEWGGQSNGYVKTLDLLLNLQPYFDAEPTWMGMFINSQMFDDHGYRVDGDIYGIPFRGTGEFLIVNKTLFSSHGWNVPETQEDLEALCDLMISEGFTPIAAFGTPSAGRIWDIKQNFQRYNLILSGLINDPKYAIDRLAEVGYNGDIARAGETARNWFKKGYFGNNPFGVEIGEAQNIFFSGKAGMFFSNNNQLNEMKEFADQSGIELAAMSWPPPAASPITFSPGGFNDGFAVWKGTKYPEECVMLLKGLTSPEVQTMWGDKGMSIVATKGIRYSDPMMQYWADVFEKARTYPNSADYNSGTLGEDQHALFTDFCLDDSMSPQQYEDKEVDLQLRAIADSDALQAGS
jgi:ABC-type glycerol-3-phosphate transport system substrate-binding protein